MAFRELYKKIFSDRPTFDGEDNEPIEDVEEDARWEDLEPGGTNDDAERDDKDCNAAAEAAGTGPDRSKEGREAEFKLDEGK